MAQSAKATNLWDSEHSEDGQQLVSNNETYCDMLINNSTLLFKRLKLSEIFWSLLLQCGVVDEKTKVKIEARNTEKAQVSSLVNHIMDLEVYKLHGFIWALVNSHQHQIAEQLGFSLHDYFEAETFMKYSAFRCPACHEFYTKAYIMTGCGHYICTPCVKGAQFICKNDHREDITCPVPDCNKITEASPRKGGIGLDEDITFRDLCQVLIKELMEGTDCSDCKRLIPASSVKHHCSDCDKVLCTDCTTKHKKDERSHKVLPYGREMKMKKEDKMEIGSDETLQEYLDKLKDDVSCFDSHRSILGQHENGVKEYIREEQRRMKQIIDDWAEENLEQYSTMQQQVEQRRNQSLHWQRAASELSIHLTMRPWLLDVGKDVETILDQNAEYMSSDDVNLITQLDMGCSIPTLMTPVPSIKTPDEEASGPNLGKPAAKNIDAQLKSGPSMQRRKGPRFVPSKAPEKAKYLSQWGKIGDRSKDCCIKVVGTAEGAFLVLTERGVFMLAQETATSALRHLSIYMEKATDIDAAEDGTWVLYRRTSSIIEIHDPRTEVTSWKPPGVDIYNDVCSVAISNTNIFLYSGTSRLVRTYSRDLKLVDQCDLSQTITKTSDSSGLIHVTEGGKLLIRLFADKQIYMLDLETKQVAFCISKHGATFRCATSIGGGEYILVGHRFGNCTSVFNDNGCFVKYLDVEPEDDYICSMAVSSRKGKCKVSEWGKDSDVSRIQCIKVVASPDGGFLVLTEEGVFRLVLDTLTSSLEYSLIHTTDKAADIDVAEDGTWILCVGNLGLIEIHEPGEVHVWKFQGIAHNWGCASYRYVYASSVAISNTNIFLLTQGKKTIECYNRDRKLVSQYNLRSTFVSTGYTGLLHVTESGKLLVSSPSENLIYMFDLESKQVIYCTSINGAFFRCVSSVWGGEYILAGERYGTRISVFDAEGCFVRYLHLEPRADRIFSMAVSPKEGKPTQLAVCRLYNKQRKICFYTLE